MKLNKIISKEDMAKRTVELAKELSDHIGEKENPVFIAVLKGGFIFAADLLREYPFSAEVDFIKAKSYIGKQSSGKIEIQYFPERELNGKTVILIEDIVDTGKTLKYLKKFILDKGAKKVLICSMINRIIKDREINPDFSGFPVEDSRFLVGYGLDVDEQYRLLHDVFAIEEKK